MTNLEMQREIESLKKEINNLRASFSFPKDIGDAIAERISDKEDTIDRTSTKTANIKSTIVLTGNPQSIDVPAFPDGFRVFNVGGKSYLIPYYNKNA